ncbi:DUF2291 family protein [Kushneria aurantia]|uniref:DUF2291 family protein n=1 Tax=Kushneria aurantia TaxID=504092 RepID=A0ABV6G0J7_9GAMM|nr:DUF2291 domain-containing protein [Kushneria aurantia]
MNAQAIAGTSKPQRQRARVILIAAAVVLIGAMALDTHVVTMGSEESAQSEGFVAERFGAEQFPIIRESVIERAVPAPQLAEAVLADASAAGSQYGVGEGFGPVVPVTFTGIMGESRNGNYTVDVEGVPDDITIRVQTGPAINGTELRDATGDISFGQFTNQIEYQDAGAAINDAMKSELLGSIDTANLSGRQVEVTGVFKLINPRNWLVTPVSMNVE